MNLKKKIQELGKVGAMTLGLSLGGCNEKGPAPTPVEKPIITTPVVNLDRAGMEKYFRELGLPKVNINQSTTNKEQGTSYSPNKTLEDVKFYKFNEEGKFKMYSLKDGGYAVYDSPHGLVMITDPSTQYTIQEGRGAEAKKSVVSGAELGKFRTYMNNKKIIRRFAAPISQKELADEMGDISNGIYQPVVGEPLFGYSEGDSGFIYCDRKDPYLGTCNTKTTILSSEYIPFTKVNVSTLEGKLSGILHSKSNSKIDTFDMEDYQKLNGKNGGYMLSLNIPDTTNGTTKNIFVGKIEKGKLTDKTLGFDYCPERTLEFSDDYLKPNIYNNCI
jgi:hypothetical protein